MNRAAAVVLSVAWLLAGACTGRAEPTACAPTPMQFDRAQSEVRVGRFVVRLENPDSAAAPTAWEGPLQVTDSRTGATCEVEPLGLIAQPLLALADVWLVLATFSGSNHRVETFDLARCARVFASPNLEGPITVRDGAPYAAGQVVSGFRCPQQP